MKQAKLFFIVVLTFLAYGKLYSQVEEDLLQIIENSGASEEQAEELLQITEQKNNNPFKIYNVNTLSREEMILLGLNNFQILALENYILRTGELFSVNELRFINGFDSVTVSHLLPFLTAAPRTEKHSLKPDSVFKNSVSTLRLQYVQNLKTPYGFTRQDGKGFVGGG
ncbi:MAG: hypothetical protein IJ681_10585 [Bacteroidales bacterium]|nr:hypothetical protein [Bacteroidales bacterium]